MKMFGLRCSAARTRLIFLGAALLHCANWQEADATTCTSNTASTCTKSLFVTGSCSSGKCACESGYEPVRTGCIEKITPDVSFTIVDGGLNDGLGSGEVLTGGKITLRCNFGGDVSGGRMAFVWMKGSESGIITGEEAQTLALDSATGDVSGQYMCKAKNADMNYESGLSGKVTVTVIAADGAFQKHPVVTGTYPKSLINGVIDLVCSNLPSGLGLTYEWYVEGEKQSGETSRTYQITMAANMADKSVTCKIVKTSAAVTATFASPESPAVKTPVIASDISGVAIVQKSPLFVTVNKEALVLDCKITDTDLAVPQGAVSYTWKKNNSLEAEQNSAKYTNPTPEKFVDTANYTCIGKVGDQPEKVSDPVDVQPLFTVIWGPEEEYNFNVVAKPAQPLEGSYVTLMCNVMVRDLSLVEYEWSSGADLQTIIGQKDSILQINNYQTSDQGNYKCQARVGLTVKSTPTIMLPAPQTLSDKTPTVTASKVATENYGIGNKYTLTCSNPHHTPGMTYIWKKGATEISGQTKQTYIMTVEEGTATYTCQMKFNQVTSQPSAVLSVEGKNIVSVQLEVAGVNTANYSNSLKPVTDSTLTFKCLPILVASATGSVQYSWKRDGTAITGETSSTYSFTAAAAQDGALQCVATLGSETLESASVTVTAGTAVAETTLLNPMDDPYRNQKFYAEGGSYYMICSTSSHSDEITYTFLKDGNVINGPTVGQPTYMLTNAQMGSSGDSGDYTCRASVGSKSATSSAKIVEVGESGRPCLATQDCMAGPEYSGVCTQDNRCICADGYQKKANRCTSGAISAMVASALMVLLSACFSPLL